MTLTIDLPDALASRFNTLLPEEARQRFAVAAIADALLAQEQDSAECMAAVEEAFADMEAGRTTTLAGEAATSPDAPTVNIVHVRHAAARPLTRTQIRAIEGEE